MIRPTPLDHWCLTPAAATHAHRQSHRHLHRGRRALRRAHHRWRHSPAFLSTTPRLVSPALRLGGTSRRSRRTQHPGRSPTGAQDRAASRKRMRRGRLHTGILGRNACAARGCTPHPAPRSACSQWRCCRRTLCLRKRSALIWAASASCGLRRRSLR
jgi:hypothetical protein